MAIPAIVGAGAYNKDCPKVLANLDEWLLQNPNTKRTPLALIGAGGFFRSSLNESYRQADAAVIGSGKIKTVELNYLPRKIIADLPAAGTVDPCTVPATDPYTNDTVTFTPVETAYQIGFKNADWIRSCETLDEAMMKRLNQGINAFLLAHERDLVAQLVAGAGGNANYTKIAGEIATITGLVDANGVLAADQYQKMEEDFLINELDGDALVAFYGYKCDLRKLDSVKEFGCCNDLGIDQSSLAEMADVGSYRSKSIELGLVAAGVLAPAAAKQAIFMHPGSGQLVEYFRYAEDPFTHGESLGRVYTDPFSGESMDYKQEFDSCNETWTITLWKRSMIWTAPTDMYQATDDLGSVNGIWHYQFD